MTHDPGRLLFARTAVDPARHVYVPRGLDDVLSTRIADPDLTLTHVQGSRMSGKSSLASKLGYISRQAGLPTAFLDFGTVVNRGNGDLITTALVQIAAKLRIPFDITDARSPADALAAIAQRSEQETGARPLIVLDETDAILADSSGPSFLAMLREITALGAAAPHFLILSVRPLTHLVPNGEAATNICSGEDVYWLDEFANDAASQSALVKGFPPDMRDRAPALAWKALEQSGGYAQVCTWLCDVMIRTEFQAGLQDLEGRMVRLFDAEARRSRPPFFDHPRRYLTAYAQGRPTTADPDPRTTTIDALWEYLNIARRRKVAYDSSWVAHQLLLWSGLARRDQDNLLRTRAPLLSRIYDTDWSRRVRVEVEGRPGSALVAGGNGKRKLPKVCLINTGGTIGMLPDLQGYIRASTADSILNHFGEIRQVADVEYVEVTGQALDSANITPEHWRKLSEQIAAELERDDVKGVVVAHGTDTLAYTASAVAFALGPNLDRPVVFTASQTTVAEVHGDARSNLVRACMVAGQAGRRLPEVAVVFGDKVLRACRAQKTDDRLFDGFNSPSWPPLARILHYLDIDPRATRPIPEESAPLDVRADFDDQVLLINQFPGLRTSVLDDIFESILESGTVHGVIIQSLGAGNLTTMSPYSLVGFVERAVDFGVPVVLGSRIPISISDSKRFEPADAALHAGAIPLFNMTEAAMVAKVQWALGQTSSEPSTQRASNRLSQLLMHDYVGEIDPSGLESLYKDYREIRRADRITANMEVESE